MNLEKVKEVITAIEADLERWDQASWTNIGCDKDTGTYDTTLYKEKTEKDQIINCGTTACVAGHAAFLFAPVGTRFYHEHLKLPFNKDTGMRSTISYDDFATMELGLTWEESEYLFNSNRKWEEITHYIAAGEEERHAILVKAFGGAHWLECHDDDGNHTCGFTH